MLWSQVSSVLWPRWAESNRRRPVLETGAGPALSGAAEAGRDEDADGRLLDRRVWERRPERLPHDRLDLL